MSEEMTSSHDLPTQAPESLSPGQKLRKARESAGLHIVALAAALKVPVRKLEALEADRWQELTDATFIRALASSVARHLRVDSAAILDGLPTVAPKAIAIPDGLGKASESTRLHVSAFRITPMYWGVLGILVAAVLMYFVPGTWLQWPFTRSGSVPDVTSVQPVQAPEMSMPAPPVSPGTAETNTEQLKATQENTATPPVPHQEGGGSPALAVPPVSQVPSTTSVPSVASETIKVAIKVSANSWLDISGKDGKVLFQRVAKPGEVIEFDNAAGYSVVVGNVAGTQILVRGQPFDMTEFNRNNVARFEVK